MLLKIMLFTKPFIAFWLFLCCHLGGQPRLSLMDEQRFIIQGLPFLSGLKMPVVKSSWKPVEPPQINIRKEITI